MTASAVLARITEHALMESSCIRVDAIQDSLASNVKQVNTEHPVKVVTSQVRVRIIRHHFSSDEIRKIYKYLYHAW